MSWGGTRTGGTAGFYCGEEKYEQWNWVGPTFVQMAKDLFPDLASQNARSVWRKEAIEQLVAALPQADRGG